MCFFFFFFFFSLNSNKRSFPQCDNAPRMHGQAFEDSLILCCYDDMCNHNHNKNRLPPNHMPELGAGKSVIYCFISTLLKLWLCRCLEHLDFLHDEMNQFDSHIRMGVIVSLNEDYPFIRPTNYHASQ